MPLNVDPKIARYYDLTFIYCGFVFCDDCKREIEYTSEHPEHTDESYYDAAVAMHAAGWIASGEAHGHGFGAFCPTCAGKHGQSPASSNQTNAP